MSPPSFYSSWETEVSEELLSFLVDPTDEIPLDSLFTTPNNNAYSLVLPSSFSDPIDFDLCRCPKRPRSCNDLISTSKKSTTTCLSAQSVAARERRKKISEKTQELGRLIPGGNKMNTAEMFQAAFKYVKFLQAQIHVLGLMKEGCEGLQVLVTSPAVQEKLGANGKCVVTKGFVEMLMEEELNPVIARDLDRFVRSMG